MDKKFVVPGDFIGTEEEYLSGEGTFSDREKIYASITGEASESARKLAVMQHKPLRALAIGTVIIGAVENISEPIALVSMRVGVGEHRFGETDEYAVLHAFRLSTDAEELGAIKAYCAKCRHPMKVESGILQCQECGTKDNRKIAKDYRKADIDY